MTPTLSDDALIAGLTCGEIELQGQFTRGYNYTFLVNIRCEGREIPAVYKPLKGEQPLWDFPENTLAGREVAAYLVSQALGFGVVPPTVLRADGPFGPGSFQQYIEYNPNYNYFTFKPADLERLRPLALFDLLVNNADRKGGHIIVQKRTRHLYGIDHGLCFHVENKLRTVVWDFAGEDIPPELLLPLERFRSALTGSLAAQLQPYLSPEEIAALTARAEGLLAAGKFPLPPEDRRSYPYPPL